LEAAGELKTKPTQHSVKALLELGVQPDILVCRTSHHLPKELRKKIALFCNVQPNAVIESIDAPSIYDVPLLMLKEELDKTVLSKLKLSGKDAPDLSEWKGFLSRLKNPTSEVEIGIIGKYVELKDAYKSIAEALIHAGAANECKVNIHWIHSEHLTVDNVKRQLKSLNGILVAPGFGNRGVEGKLEAVRYARENKIPFLGICLGMQMAAIEFARNVLHLKASNSQEIDPQSPHQIIHLMEEQKQITAKGGTMRLGNYSCKLKKGTLIHKAYQESTIHERHRHRYEFNNEFLQKCEENGLIASGVNPELNLVETIEIKEHPWFVGVQYHPEYKSTVMAPHPLFVSFVKATKKEK
jgi:CTP synthase